jgi:glycosyltransferase involved in cell wall biosynthesis
VDELFRKSAVLIPAFNAGNTLDTLLARLFQYVPPANVLVVDDGSTDDTAAIALRRETKVISLGDNRGKGAALARGFDVLKSDSRFDCIATLDADLQHRPENLASFIQERIQTGADIVIGLRNRIGTKMPIHRRLSNAITSYLVSVRTGKKVLDSQCGFRLIGRDVLSHVTLKSFGFEAETEFLIKAIKQGYTVHFVPIETIYNGEKSHMTNWSTTLDFIRVLFHEY